MEPIKFKPPLKFFKFGHLSLFPYFITFSHSIFFTFISCLIDWLIDWLCDWLRRCLNDDPNMAIFESCLLISWLIMWLIERLLKWWSKYGNVRQFFIFWWKLNPWIKKMWKLLTNRLVIRFLTKSYLFKTLSLSFNQTFW